MLTPEQLAEIERPVPMGSGALWKLNEQKGQLLAEVKSLREQVEVTRHLGKDEAAQASYEAMDTERRGQESRRAVENVTLANLRRERDAALDHVRRLCIQRDTVARAVRSPNLTDEQKFAEIREAFAIVEGQRESGEESEAHAGSVWTCPACLDSTCGDCLEGRCHGSGPCGCDRHEASVQARQLHEADADEAGEGR